MLYVLYGTDTNALRAKVRSMTDSLHMKRPEAEVFRLHDENWSDPAFEELLVAQGLFDQKYIVILDQLFGDKERKEKIVEVLDVMKDSEHVFLLIEGDVDKKTLDKLEKYAAKAQEFASKEGKTVRFNTFSLADAFARRDKKNLWIGFLEALDQGISAEEITGVLFWQAKAIVLAMKTKDAKESKLSPYADTKARAAAKNFSHEEILEKSDSLVRAASSVREGMGDMETLLEKWILTM